MLSIVIMSQNDKPGKFANHPYLVIFPITGLFTPRSPLHTHTTHFVKFALFLLHPPPSVKKHRNRFFYNYFPFFLPTNLKDKMATAANSYYFRRRTMGRAASPPTWACYEQIHNEDDSDSDCSDSNSDSCSEEDEDFKNNNGSSPRIPSSAAAHRRSSMNDSDDNEQQQIAVTSRNDDDSEVHQDIDMDMDVDTAAERQKDVKGKQRAVEPEPESPRRQKKKRSSVYTLRPILTIQRSQGFVWNQVSTF